MATIIETIKVISNLVIAVSMSITALLVIVQSLTKFNPLLPIRNWLNKPIKEQITKLDEKNTDEHQGLINIVNEHTLKLEEIGVAKLKSDICNPNLPLSERVIAGKIYVDEKGLNGEVKMKVKGLNKRYEKELEEKGY